MSSFQPPTQTEESSLCTSGSSSSQCEPDKSVPGTFFLSERWKPSSIRNLLIFNQSRKPDLSIRFEGNILPQKNKKEAESSKAEIWDPFFNLPSFYKTSLPLLKKIFFLPNLTLLCACVLAKSLESCPTLCNLMDSSLPVFSDHGIISTRILESSAISSSRGSSQLRYGTCFSCIGRQILYHWATWEAPLPL